MVNSQTHKSQGKKLLEQLLSKGLRIFSMKDFIQVAKEINIPRSQLNKIVSTLAYQEWLIRLKRGLYMANDPVAGLITIHPFLIASHLIENSVISHWSAAQHHGLTEQIPQVITASTTKKVITPSMRKKSKGQKANKHVFQINDLYYEFITIKKNHLYGIEKIWIDEYSQVSITDKERTLIDIFLYPRMFGGISEAFGMLESSLSSIDIKKLIKYTLMYEKKSLAKRLGWILEKLGVDKKVLKPLLDIPIHYYCRLDPSGPAKGKCEKRWMILNNSQATTNQRRFIRREIDGKIHIPTNKYYEFRGFLEILEYYLTDEIASNRVEDFTMRTICLSLSIIIENSFKEIFDINKIKFPNNLERTIEQLKNHGYISEMQKVFLHDFRQLRNDIAHKTFINKIYFRKKSLMTKDRIRKLIINLCNIISDIEENSNSKTTFNHKKFIKFISEQ